MNYLQKLYIIPVFSPKSLSLSEFTLNMKPLCIVIACVALSVGSLSVAAQNQGQAQNQSEDTPGTLESRRSVTLDIPGQALNTALVEFGIQANTDFIAPAELIGGYRSVPVVGYFSLEKALELFLANTPLAFEVREEGVVLRLDKEKLQLEPPSPKDGEGLNVLEEMLVTSRRREEALIDVPMSVVAVGGEELQDKGVTDFFRFGLITPNLTVAPIHGTNSTMTAFIRGIGQYDSYAGFESGVGIYIDDVYINRPQGILAELYDTERIEVLRGPQGTLYGRNSLGGAIKYVSKPLSDIANASVELSFGDYDQSNLVLRAGGATEDTRVRFGGTFVSSKKDGFGRNLITREENYNKDIKAYRFSSKFFLNEKASVELSLDHSNDNSISRAGRSTFYEFPTLSDISDYDGFSGINFSDHPINKFSMKASGQTLKFLWADSGYEFKSIHARRGDKTRTPLDLDAVFEHYLETYILYKNDQVSHEIQLSKKLENYSFVFGAFYIDADAFHVSDYRVQNAISFHLVDVEASSKALFFDAEARLFEKVLVSLGTRYTEEKNTTFVERDLFYSVSSSGLRSRFFGGDLPSIYDEFVEDPFPLFLGVRTDKVATPRVSLSWYPEENLHFYSAYSKGFRGGGFDPRGRFGYEEVQRGYSPEVLDTYEVGLKSRNQNTELNIAVFFSDYNDIQIYGGISVEENNERVVGLSNDASATVKGIEFDYKYSLASTLELGVSLGWNDSKYDRSIDLSGNDIAGGVRLLNLPDKSAALSVAYRYSLGEGTLSAILSASYRSETYLFNLPVENSIQPSYWIADLGVKWEAASKSISLGIGVHNVFDQRYKASVFYIPEYNVNTAYFGDPRTITGSIKMRF